MRSDRALNMFPQTPETIVNKLNTKENRCEMMEKLVVGNDADFKYFDRLEESVLAGQDRSLTLLEPNPCFKPFLQEQVAIQQ